MYDNVNDAIIGTANGDYRNGFSIGGIIQLYSGNIEDSFIGGTAINLQIASNSFCENSVANITPLNDLEYKSTNTDVAYYEDQMLNLISPGEFYLYGFDKATNCHTNLSDLQIVVPTAQISFIGPNMINIGETTSVSPSIGGTWSSSNTAVATVSNSGLVTGVANGVAGLEFTDQNGCISESLLVTVNMPSNTVDLNNTIDVFPNPSNGLYFTKGYNPAMSLNIYGVDGKKIDFSKNGNAIDLSEFPDGIYYMEIQTKSRTITKRLIKSTY